MFKLKYKKIIILLLLLFSTSIIAQKPKVLLVKGDYDYPPYEFLNDKNVPDGFNVDIINAVAKEMGMKVKIELGKWSIVRNQLKNGKIDALIGMFYSKKRDENFDFSIPHFMASYTIFVNKKSKIKSLDDVTNKVIIVNKGDLADDYIRENNITKSIVEKTTSKKTLIALSKGKGDLAIISRLQGFLIIKNEKINNLKAVGPPIIQSKYSIAVKEGNSSLLAKFNEGLAIIKTNGKYDKIYDKWFRVYNENQNQELNFEKIIKYIIWFAIPLVIIIILAFLWTFLLRKEVSRKTKELQSSQENLKITLDSIGDAVIATNKDGYITMMNPVAEKLTAWLLKDAEGLHLDKVFKVSNSQTNKKIENSLEKILEAKTLGLANHTILTSKDNMKYQISDSGAPIKNNLGEIIGGVLVFSNISKEFLMQEKLLHYSKMEAIGELTGGVAHDFNNMLAGIMGAAQLLESIEELSENTERKEYINLIIGTTKRAANLTSKLLAFGRKDSAKNDVIDLKKIIKDTSLLLKGTIDKKIKINIDAISSNNIIKGNKSALQNIFMNIGINASHAMPNGGSLNIKIENKNLDKGFCNKSTFCIKPGRYVSIEITDTGHGISKENIKKIFEPFFTTKSKNKGTGLGLSAVYEIVQDHNGLITVDSEEGKGTTFKILLPCFKGNMKFNDDKDQTVIKGSGLIFLVDDEDIIRKTGKSLLTKLGYQVLVAENGQEAIEIFKKQYNNIDLVITDMVMPEMNGKDLFKKIKEIKEDCKVIISSGFINDKNTQELKDLGISGFLCKPYKNFELSQLLNQILNKKALNKTKKIV